MNHPSSECVALWREADAGNPAALDRHAMECERCRQVRHARRATLEAIRDPSSSPGHPAQRMRVLSAVEKVASRRTRFSGWASRPAFLTLAAVASVTLAVVTLRMSPPLDTDHDGTPDVADRCPELKGRSEFSGCPFAISGQDSDGDGVLDAADACPHLAGEAASGGCPSPRSPSDRDGDGIADVDDRCPTEAGLRRNGGCPG